MSGYMFYIFLFFHPIFPFVSVFFFSFVFLSLDVHFDCCLLVKIDSCVSPSSSGDLSRHPVPYSLTHACSSRWLYSSCRERRMVWNMTGLKSTAFDPWVVVSVVSFHAVHFRSADDRFCNIGRSAYHVLAAVSSSSFVERLVCLIYSLDKETLRSHLKFLFVRQWLNQLAY